MFFKKATKIDSRIETLIGPETSLVGDIEYSGGLRIDGKIRGNITESADTPGTLIIGDSGSIEGKVSAAKISLSGKVVGPVHASEFIELQPKAHITGDLYYKALEMHTGAVIQGNLVYIGDKSSAE